MSAKQPTPVHTPRPEFKLMGGKLLCANQYNQSDTYYFVDPDGGESAIGVQWGDGEKDWGYFTISQLCEGMMLHLQSKGAPVSIVAAVGAAALALDRDHVKPEFFVRILQSMHETGSQHGHDSKHMKLLEHVLAQMQVITGAQQALDGLQDELKPQQPPSVFPFIPPQDNQDNNGTSLSA